MNEILQAPAPSCLIREARGLIELPRLLLRFPVLALQPRGNGEPILLFPGHGMGDGSTVILKVYLRLIGYRARGLGLGRNMGAIADLLPRPAELSRIDGKLHQIPRNLDVRLLHYRRDLIDDVPQTWDTLI